MVLHRDFDVEEHRRGAPRVAPPHPGGLAHQPLADGTQLADPVDRVEHFEHGKAAAVAAVHDVASLRVGDQQVEHVDMGGGEVADMDIVADAGAVGRGVIGAVDGDRLALADRRLDGMVDVRECEEEPIADGLHDLAAVLSFIPFFSQTVMPARYALERRAWTDL